MSNQFETLIVERQDGVVTVTMNRPARKNAANGTMWRELLATFDDVATDRHDPGDDPDRGRRRVLFGGRPRRPVGCGRAAG